MPFQSEMYKSHVKNSFFRQVEGSQHIYVLHIQPKWTVGTHKITLFAIQSQNHYTDSQIFPPVNMIINDPGK